jgi:methylmalonyl-CoA/ethylmalonyl-CoA epimerase
MDSVVKNIHHVGYLVKNITDSIEMFKILGYSVEKDVFEDEGRNASICFLTSSGTRVELVSPYKNSELYSLLKKYRNTPYHICYEVEDISSSIDSLKEAGFLVFSEEENAPAISQTAKVVFMINADIGMIELVELGG